MSKFDVWIEGFRATGERGEARILGEEVEAENFKAACRIAAAAHRLTPLLNADCTTVWGCRFFDNQTDARRSFG